METGFERDAQLLKEAIQRELDGLRAMAEEIKARVSRPNIEFRKIPDYPDFLWNDFNEHLNKRRTADND